MPDKIDTSSGADELRHRAEIRFHEQHLDCAAVRPDADVHRLIHELQVHQIELEMQNEELQQARNNVEVLMEKYSDLYDFAPVGYLTLDREGIIREANLTVASLLGMERSRLVKRCFRQCVSGANLAEFNAFLSKTFESMAKQSCDITLLKEEKPPFEARIEATIAASGHECRAAVMDITERKQAERDRLILSKLESTGILAGGIAHDFNNLLTAIILNLDLAKTPCLSREDLIKFLGEAMSTAKAAHGLTQKLITFSTGGMPVLKSTCLSEMIQTYSQSALCGSRARCEFSLPNGLWQVNADEGQLGQVIHNLVMNAHEAMPEGGVISVRAENLVLDSEDVPGLSSGNYIRLSIKDQGGGISKELQPKIFDPYFSTKQRCDIKGMGLGLTICHAIIAKHGGAITVDSSVGVGTTFHIYLPASGKLSVE